MFNEIEVLTDVRNAAKDTTDLSSLADLFIVYGYSNQLSKWTMRTRTTHVKHFIEFCTVARIISASELTLSIVDAFFKHYGYSHSESTVNTSKRIIRTFLIWVDEYKEVNLKFKPSSIHSRNNKSKMPKHIDSGIIKQVIDNSEKHQSLLIELGYSAGLRISELISIRVKDINNDSIYIRGKGGIDRTVYIKKGLSLKLQRRIYGRPPDDILFRSKWDTPLSKQSAWLYIKSAFMDIAGIEMYPHQLRHSFAVSLLLNGCDIVTIQHLLGHADLSTTQIYLKLTDKQVRNNYKKYMP